MPVTMDDTAIGECW